MHLQEGTLLQGGKYKIVRFISSGGFGCTYEAIHTGFDERVAIKEFFVKDFCNRDETTAQVSVGTTSKVGLVKKIQKKFVDEARAIRKLKHNNIVQVTDVFEENGTAYYVMDYIDGLSLNDIVKRDGALSEQKALKYIRQIADALKYVHSQNRLHLDVKPGNIMIDKEDNAILIDFGASKQYDEEAGENTSTLLGKTPGYAPLEQMGNDVVKFYPSTDIYALGATLYKLLTGITPPSATLLASGEELPPFPSSISGGIRNAVHKAMQINKNKRPQSIEEFLALLDSRIEDDNNDDDTVCVAEEAKSHKEERNQNVEEQKASNIAKISGSKKSWLWAVLGVVVLAGVIIGVTSKGKSSADGDSTQSEETAQSENNALPQQKTFMANGVSFNMISVEGGTFTMGATSEQGSDAVSDEEPAHNVTLSNYYIGEHEVTQELWQAVMGSNPSESKGSRKPVENVSWDDCQIFISKLNSLTGKQFRLPTEAEWEYAARGGNRSQGYKYSGSNNLSDVAWYDDNSGGTTHDVGMKRPNELGIYDMSGNVWEWCQDWFGDYSSNSQTNPTGASSGPGRVVRGGGWWYDAGSCRSSFRIDCAPGISDFTLGLRLVLVP